MTPAILLTVNLEWGRANLSPAMPFTVYLKGDGTKLSPAIPLIICFEWVRTNLSFDILLTNYLEWGRANLTLAVGPSVDDQAVSLSDDGTTIIIDFFSSFSLLLLPPFNSSHSPLAF